MPRNNAFYATIAGMSPIYRYVFTVLVVACISYLWLFQIYFKVDGVITTYRKEIEHIREQSSACDCSEKSCKRLECTVTDLHRAMHEYQTHNNIDERGGASMAYLLDSAERAGLTLNSCVAQRDEDKQTFVLNSIDIDGDGTIAQLISFLSVLKTSGQVINYKQLQLARTRDDIFSIRCSLDFVLLKKKNPFNF